MRDHINRYRWLSEIYELYLEEFKRLDFDAEIYAAKTRKLIQASTRLLNFRGHLPEIKIDTNYLNQLQDTKLSPGDKAEKIIRDIETVIRQNEINSAGTFEIFITIKNARIDTFDEALARSFAEEVVKTVIRKKIYIGWQDNDSKIKRIRLGIQIFAADDVYQPLAVDDDEVLINTIMKSVVRYYSAT